MSSPAAELRGVRFPLHPPASCKSFTGAVDTLELHHRGGVTMHAWTLRAFPKRPFKLWCDIIRTRVSQLT
ncbi:hypothetical protein VTI28DRAFT_7790 [Corynascus sepedonium]